MQGLDKNRFHFNDLALLKSGQFSDAKLTLGDKTWHVHKSIVCPRSGYMQDVLSHSSTAELEEAAISGAEEHIDLILEFIYSGSIKTIDDLLLCQLVKLCGMGRVFGVDGMVCYMVTTLWDKLTPMLQTLSSIPIPVSRDTDQSWATMVESLENLRFIGDFKVAVSVAYWDDDNACQLVLADFVWAARTWLLCDPVIHKLNNLHPRFGSHVLTTLQKGPQSPFLVADKLFKSAAAAPASTLCPNCARAQV